MWALCSWEFKSPLRHSKLLKINKMSIRGQIAHLFTADIRQSILMPPVISSILPDSILLWSLRVTLDVTPLGA